MARERTTGVNGKYRYLAVTAVAAVAVTLAGCSTASSIVKHLSTTRPSAAASTKQAAAPAAPGALTGKWSGTYSGSYHGTFSLHWVQTGCKDRNRSAFSCWDGMDKRYRPYPVTPSRRSTGRHPRR